MYFWIRKKKKKDLAKEAGWRAVLYFKTEPIPPSKTPGSL
jgi:hypothetical protein